MSNPKVFEFAKEIGMTPLALMDKIREWHLPVKSHMSELEPEMLEQIKVKLRSPDKAADEKPKKTATKKAPAKKAEAPTAAKKSVAGPVKSSAVKAPAAKAPAAKAASAKAATAAATAPATAPVAGGKTPVIRRKAKDPSEEISTSSGMSASDENLETAVTSSSSAAPLRTAVARTVEDVQPKTEATAPSRDEAAFAAPSRAAETSIVKPASAASASAVSTPVASTPAPLASTASPAATAGPPVAARKKEVSVGTSGVSSNATPVSTVGRKNIIGRMDLSRVAQNSPRPSSGGGQNANAGPGQRPGFGGPPRSGNRNLRAGFVVAPSAFPEPAFGGEDFDKKKSTLDKRTKRLESTGTLSAKEKEQEELQNFNAVEFRKREMVFQPKKKKGMLNRAALQTQITQPKASKRVVKVDGSMKVNDLAMEMGLKAAQLIKTLMTNGVMANMNTVLDFDTIALIVPEFGWEAQNVKKTAEDVVLETAFGELDAENVLRPPVVTVMGHVDHGKTSLLDAIRKTDVAAGEAGGITQHIGAYNVTLEDGSKITFLDTPGHEAFTAMRARGANATDIAIIVVAADDGVMPQTAEAINHAKAAKVPIIVAVNKIDKPGANLERIKQQMTEFELVPEEWGGTTIFAPVSALKRQGVKELLEQIKLVAEMQELKANPLRSGTGLVIEAKLEKGKGPVATLLVKDGTVKIGQSIVAGKVRGRVRSLMNERGERVTEAGPGQPVEVLGLEETPNAGDKFDIVADEETAHRVAQLRAEQARAAAAPTEKLSLEDIFSKVNRGDVKELSLILKGDVQGSVEAVQGMLNKLSTSEVKTKVIHSAVGGINESDVLLAQTSKGIILGFNVRPDTGAAQKAKQIGVEVRTYSIVYELIDDMKKAMAGLLTPDVVEKVLGRAEVRNTFSVPKIGVIAGCFVADGKIQRSNMARLIRDGKIVYEGRIGSLKRFKDDAREVAQGYECGIGIENFNDVKVGDIIESFVKEEVARELKPEAQA